jgi:hypothetical protein
LFGRTETSTMLQFLLWAAAAVALLALGWWASARHHQRKIDFLQVQLKVTRQTAQAHGDQARRQIGQLQADLASRPPAPQPRVAPEDVPADTSRRKLAVPDRFERHDDGFPHTAVIGPGFAPTELQG